MKKFLSKNYAFILIVFIVIIVVNIRFPYYIDTPGGISDVSSKVKINFPKSKGTFNLAYVKEYPATLPTLLISLFNKDWDIIKQEDVLMDDEKPQNYELRDKFLMDESVSNSIFVAYTSAGKNIEIISSNIMVTYIVPIANTNLEVGDKILSINDKKIKSKADISKILDLYNIGDKLSIQVESGNKKITRYAYIVGDNDLKKIGLLITETNKYNLDPKVKIKTDDNESGSSGGLIMTLYLYDALVDKDITKGLKIVGTGTIDLDGNVGSIGGVKYKLKSAEASGADVFLLPLGSNYEDAIKIKKEKKYKIKIIGVATFEDALNALNELK